MYALVPPIVNLAADQTNRKAHSYVPMSLLSKCNATPWYTCIDQQATNQHHSEQ